MPWISGKKSVARLMMSFALLAATTLAGHAQGTATPPGADSSTTPRSAVVSSATWDPMLDEMRALPEGQRNTTSSEAVRPQYQTVNPNFGGFRVAPYTAAHKPGDTSRQISSVEGDFNYDGCADIVSFQTTSLTVMTGDCKGHFRNAGSQSTAINVFHPVAVDVNHDGYPDVIAMTVPFAYNGTVVVLINQKNGTFAAPVTISKKAALYSGLQGFNVYDVNGDGNPDVVISGTGTVDNMSNSNLVFEVIFGNADGTFNTATLVETDGTLPYKPTIAFDGGTALRVVNGQLYLYGLLIQVQPVNGTNFGSEPLYRWAVGSNGKVDLASAEITQLPVFSAQPNKYIQFIDIDGDGTPDFTLLNGDGMLYTAVGAQDGSFGSLQAALPVSAGNNASVVSFRDVDGDGKVDAILAGGVLVGVWPGNGDGTFRAPKSTNLAGYALNSNSGLTFSVTNHVIDDFDGDGIPDVAYFDVIKRALCFYKGEATGTFIGAPALTSTSTDFPGNTFTVLATPDLNGDGFRDLIVSTPYGLLSGMNDGKGNFTYRTLSPLQGISALSALTPDFNKDGREDAIFLTTDSSGYVHLYLGLSNGDGTITAVPQTLPFKTVYTPGIAVGDFNGDGVPDVALALNNYSGQAYGVYPMVNDGSGNLTAGTLLNLGSTLYGIALADVNGDGRADLVVSYGAYAKTTTAVYPGMGNAGFASSPNSIIQNTLPGGSILAKDVTGDGKADVVLSVTNGTSEGLMLYAGNGNGIFSTGTSMVSGIIPSYVGAIDLNGDTLPDIYFTSNEAVLADANDSLDGLVVLPGIGNGSFGAPRSYAIYGSSTPVLPVDLLHNGSPDLLAAAGSNGTTILLNNGASIVAVSSSAKTLTSTGNTTITASVSPYFRDQQTPTGYVDLLIDGVTSNRTLLAANGTATFVLGNLAAGNHVVSSAYEGDASYNINSNSTTVSISVSKATPSFVITSNVSSLSLINGSSASTDLSLTANDAFSGPVTLGCTGAPVGSSCSFVQSNVTLAPGQTVTSTLTLTATQDVATHTPLPLFTAPGVSLCCLLLIAPLARRRRKVTSVVILLLAAVSSMSLEGCSSGSRPKLTSGSYTVTVTASPSDTSVASQSVTVAVMVPNQ